MMPITEQTIAEFAGIVGDTLPREGESARVGGELEQIIRSRFRFASQRPASSRSLPLATSSCWHRPSGTTHSASPAW